MKGLVLYIIITSGLVGFSQTRKFDKPDYESIDKEVNDKKSVFYYSKLFNRYNLADSTMTIDDKRHLYYGYPSQIGYSPYANSNYADSLSVIFTKNEHAPEDYKKVIKFTDFLLNVNPFDLKAINYKLYSYKEQGNIAEFKKNLTKMRIIIDAIISSGDGKTKEYSFYVISPSHEYDLLGVLGFEFGGEQNLIEQYDYVKLKENKAGITGLYFDISPCMNYFNKILKR